MTPAATGSIARLLMDALAPLADALASPAAFGQLLPRPGHEGTVEAAALADFELAVSIVDLVEQGEELVAGLDTLGDGGDVAQVVADLVAVTTDLVDLLGELADVDGASLDASLDDPAIWTDLATRAPGLSAGAAAGVRGPRPLRTPAPHWCDHRGRHQRGYP